VIENERQYRIARRAALRFEEAIAKFDRRPEAHLGVHPSHVVAEFRVLRSQLETLREEMREYEARRPS
jgi:hypothetical protein